MAARHNAHGAFKFVKKIEALIEKTTGGAVGVKPPLILREGIWKANRLGSSGNRMGLRAYPCLNP
jgi:hypothetical protein